MHYIATVLQYHNLVIIYSHLGYLFPTDAGGPNDKKLHTTYLMSILPV